jgi:hypothetical protein
VGPGRSRGSDEPRGREEAPQDGALVMTQMMIGDGVDERLSTPWLLREVALWQDMMVKGHQARISGFAARHHHLDLLAVSVLVYLAMTGAFFADLLPTWAYFVVLGCLMVFSVWETVRQQRTDRLSWESYLAFRQARDRWFDHHVSKDCS